MVSGVWASDRDPLSDRDGEMLLRDRQDGAEAEPDDGVRRAEPGQRELIRFNRGKVVRTIEP